MVERGLVSVMDLETTFFLPSVGSTRATLAEVGRMKLGVADRRGFSSVLVVEMRGGRGRVALARGVGDTGEVTRVAEVPRRGGASVAEPFWPTERRTLVVVAGGAVLRTELGGTRAVLRRPVLGELTLMLSSLERLLTDGVLQREPLELCRLPEIGRAHV